MEMLSVLKEADMMHAESVSLHGSEKDLYPAALLMHADVAGRSIATLPKMQGEPETFKRLYAASRVFAKLANGKTIGDNKDLEAIRWLLQHLAKTARAMLCAKSDDEGLNVAVFSLLRSCAKEDLDPNEPPDFSKKMQIKASSSLPEHQPKRRKPNDFSPEGRNMVAEPKPVPSCDKFSKLIPLVCRRSDCPLTTGHNHEMRDLAIGMAEAVRSRLEVGVQVLDRYAASKLEDVLSQAARPMRLGLDFSACAALADGGRLFASLALCGVRFLGRTEGSTLFGTRRATIDVASEAELVFASRASRNVVVRLVTSLALLPVLAEVGQRQFLAEQFGAAGTNQDAHIADDHVVELARQMGSELRDFARFGKEACKGLYGVHCDWMESAHLGFRAKQVLSSAWRARAFKLASREHVAGEQMSAQNRAKLQSYWKHLFGSADALVSLWDAASFVCTVMARANFPISLLQGALCAVASAVLDAAGHVLGRQPGHLLVALSDEARADVIAFATVANDAIPVHDTSKFARDLNSTVSLGHNKTLQNIRNGPGFRAQTIKRKSDGTSIDDTRLVDAYYNFSLQETLKDGHIGSPEFEGCRAQHAPTEMTCETGSVHFRRAQIAASRAQPHARFRSCFHDNNQHKLLEQARQGVAASGDKGAAFAASRGSVLFRTHAFHTAYKGMYELSKDIKPGEQENPLSFMDLWMDKVEDICNSFWDDNRIVQDSGGKVQGADYAKAVFRDQRSMSKRLFSLVRPSPMHVSGTIDFFGKKNACSELSPGARSVGSAPQDPSPSTARSSALDSDTESDGFRASDSEDGGSEDGGSDFEDVPITAECAAGPPKDRAMAFLDGPSF
jgi:hypothetical protein